MKIIPRVVLSTAAVLFAVPTASALQWNCGVPEIDGPAGLSALAALISFGVMAYERHKQ